MTDIVPGTGSTTGAEEHIRLLRELRSVRRYSSQPLSPDAVDGILDVARWTGTGHNRQAWELVLVRGSETLRALAAVDGADGVRHMADAPLAIVLVLSSTATPFDEGRLAERIMLAASAHGAGSCLAGFREAEQEAAAKAILCVPAERVLRTSIAIGYPINTRARLVSVERTLDQRVAESGLPVGRRPLAQIVHLERYGSRADS